AASARYARVVLTTLVEAAAQTWQSVILADANDEIWPLQLRENPFLPDDVRTALNARRASGQPPLLLTTERGAHDDDRFLTLLEHCEGEFLFAASAAVSEAPQRIAHPNEWLLRTLIETSPDATAAWNAAIRHAMREPPALDAAERDHLVAIHAS